MEPDDLLCSRNARPQKALVGRAQWKINQPPSLIERTSELGGSHVYRSMRAVKDSLAVPLKAKVGKSEGPRRDDGTSREIDCEAIGGWGR